MNLLAFCREGHPQPCEWALPFPHERGKRRQQARPAALHRTSYFAPLQAGACALSAFPSSTFFGDKFEPLCRHTCD